MAHRRMFSNRISFTDPYYKLPALTKLVYRSLFDYADDDGFVSNPLKVSRECDTDESAIQTLVDAGFILRFDSGVVLITDWHIHNYIRPDRYQKTLCSKELDQVVLTEDKKYVLKTVAEAMGLPLLSEPSTPEELKKDLDDFPEEEDCQETFPKQEEAPKDIPEEEPATRETAEPVETHNKIQEDSCSQQPQKELPRYMNMGTHGYMVMEEGLLNQVRLKFPSTFIDRINALEEQRIERRNKANTPFAYRQRLSKEEIRQLLAG